MKTFLITYDLVGLETYIDYSKLHGVIKKSFILWARPVRSVWIVKSDLDVTLIRDLIGLYVDNNDRLLIVETTNKMAWRNISPEVSNWLKNNA